MSLGTSDFVEAVQIADKIRSQAAAMPREQLSACMAEIESYLAQCKRARLAASTIEQRKYALQGFVKHCAVESPALITASKAQRWFDARGDENAYTAEAYLNIVRWWFEWLIERGKLRIDPTAAIKVPRLPMRVRKEFLSFERARQFIDNCVEAESSDPSPASSSEGKVDPRNHMTMLDLRFVIYCGIQHGFRKLEVIEARPEWFDLDAGLIHITKTPTFEPKGRDNRTIPMTDEFRAWLRDVYGLRSPFMLMPAVKHGKYRYRFDFRTKFENYVAAQKETITFHDLRRTFGSLLVSRGVSLYKVAKWLGDTLKVAESTYGHLVAQDDEINAAWK